MQTFFTNNTSAPATVATGPINVPKERFSPIDFAELQKLMPTDPAGKWTGPTATAQFANFPVGLGGGQYTVDKANAGTLIKTARPTDSDAEYKKRFLARGGLPSRLFEVDHIIPLALGGTDTDANKEVLNKTDHDKKTKVGAIAQSLFFAGKLNKNEALNIAINWRDKDTAGIEVKNGELVNPEIIPAKMEQWNAVPKVTFKNWWAEVKDTLKSIGPTIAKGVDYILPENAAGEFGKGVVESASLGWINPEMGKYTGGEQVANWGARLGGEVVGFFAPWTLLKKATTALKIGLTGGKVMEGFKGVKTVEEAPETLKAISETIDAIKGGGAALKDGKFVFPMNTGMRMLENAGIFATLGQLSKQEENTLDARTHRFLTDIAFGGILGTSPQTWKGVSALAMGTYTLSALSSAFDENTTVADGQVSALLNTAIVTGLASMGKVHDTKMREQTANEVSQKILGLFGVQKNVGESLTKEETNKIFNTINEKYSNDPMAIKREREAVILANRQLYKGGMTATERKKADTADLQSLTAWLRKDNQPVSKESRGAFDKMKAVWQDTNTPGESMIIGTGQGVSKDLELNVRKLAGTNSMEAVGKPVLISMDDRPWYVKLIKETGKYEQPEKNLPIIAEIDGKKVLLSYVPDKANMERINAKMKGYTLPTMDEGMWRIPLYDKMQAEGIRNLPARISYVNPSTVTSGKAALSIEVSPESWAMAKQMAGLAKAEVKSTVKKAIQKTPALPRVTKVTADTQGNFNNLIDSFNRKINAGPDQLASYMQTFVTTPLTKEAKSRMVNEAKSYTVKDLAAFFVQNARRGTLTKIGKATYDLNFNKNTGAYYGTLPNAEREIINANKIYSPIIRAARTGEIKQEIPITPIEEINPPAVAPAPVSPPIQEITSLPESVFQGVRRGKTLEKSTVNKVTTALANRPSVPPINNKVLEAAKRNPEVERMLNEMDSQRAENLQGQRTAEDILRKEKPAPEVGNLTELEREIMIRNVSTARGYSEDKISKLQKTANDWLKNRDPKDGEYLTQNGIGLDMLVSQGPKVFEEKTIPSSVLATQLKDSIAKSKGKIKSFWSEFVKQLDQKKANWQTTGKLDMTKIKDLSGDVFKFGKMAGREQTIDSRIEKYAAMVRMGTSGWKKLPLEIQKSLQAIRKQYPKTKIIVNTTEAQRYNKERFYNVFKDIRDFVKKESSEDYFNVENKTLSEVEKKNLAKEAKLSDTEIQEYLPNVISEKNLSEQKTFNIFSYILTPLIDKGLLKRADDKAIKNIAEDFAQLISKCIR
jgi:hypothetical protein